jgi:hypothetical protein
MFSPEISPKKETPHGGGASHNQLGGWLRDPLTPTTLQSQFLIAAYNVRPEWAAILAASAFGEASQ